VIWSVYLPAFRRCESGAVPVSVVSPARMHFEMVMDRASNRRDRCSSWSRGVASMIFFGGVIFKVGEQVALGLGEPGALPGRARWASKGRVPRAFRTQDPIRS
jgi:hypothetical protein